MFRRVGDLIGAVQSADRLVRQFEETAAEIKRRQIARMAPAARTEGPAFSCSSGSIPLTVPGTGTPRSSNGRAASRCSARPG